MTRDSPTQLPLSQSYTLLMQQDLMRVVPTHLNLKWDFLRRNRPSKMTDEKTQTYKGPFDDNRIATALNTKAKLAKASHEFSHHRNDTCRNVWVELGTQITVQRICLDTTDN